MKKIMTLIFVCFIALSFGKMNTSAGQFDSLPTGRNYLSLSNLQFLDTSNYYASTINKIRVKENTNYTLVVDYHFIGHLESFIDTIYVEIEELDGGHSHDDFILDDQINERVYFQFKTVSQWIHIKQMPIGHSNSYNAMLYEGTYQDFSGFVPYTNPSEIMNYQGLLPMDYDNLLSIDQIKSYISAYGSERYALLYDVLEDNYSSSNKLPGAYQMTFQVEHNYITKKYVLDLKVFDLASPIISVPNSIEIPLAKKIDVNEIKSLLSVVDNVDVINSSSLSILSDTYTDATTLGTYHVLFEASDSSGNKSTLEVPITLVDKQGPVIKGPKSIYLYTTDAPLSNDLILLKYVAMDDVDGQVSVSIHNNLYLQKEEQGAYEIVLTSIDAQLNRTYKYITVHVIENKGPIFETNDKIIEKSVADAMTDEEIITWFRAQLVLSQIAGTNVKILFNEYNNNEKLSGSYYVYLTYENNGVIENSRIRIDVIDEESSIPYALYITIASGLLVASISTTYYVKKKRK